MNFTNVCGTYSYLHWAIGSGFGTDYRPATIVAYGMFFNFAVVRHESPFFKGKCMFCEKGLKILVEIDIR
jgi:hypothetical protein